MDETLEMIIENTGRKPVSCSCSECQQQCKTPCLGTPDDIINLIKAGYAKKTGDVSMGHGINSRGTSCTSDSVSS